LNQVVNSFKQFFCQLQQEKDSTPKKKSAKIFHGTVNKSMQLMEKRGTSQLNGSEKIEGYDLK